eukprot:TRINITY_DN3280_c0_g1_i6.p1 TRINITY_DN3280_c0_g1~~TRINITY_DN3280_c0_g1_i6.p1  ORF type:complete len:437 (+),score=84.30 TRINITY_DN3280_c0_g1_i6:78-1388(+)
MKFRVVFEDGLYIRADPSRGAGILGEVDYQQIVEGDDSVVSGWVRVPLSHHASGVGWIACSGADGSPYLLPLHHGSGAAQPHPLRLFEATLRSHDDVKELAWSDGQGRCQQRLLQAQKFLELLHTLRDSPPALLSSELWLWLGQQRPTSQTLDSTSIFALSELIFFLRYYTEREDWSSNLDTFNSNRLFTEPQPNTEAFDTYTLFVESCGVGLGWRHYVLNQLESMTACGHFADTLLRTLYFPCSASASHACHSLPLNSLPVLERPAALRQLLAADSQGAALPSDYGYLIRIEVNRNHVYLLDIPCTAFAQALREPVADQPDAAAMAAGWGLRLESTLRVQDSCVKCVDVAWELGRCRGQWLNEFLVYRYDSAGLVQRLSAAVAMCWQEEALHAPIGYRSHTKRWSQILDLVFRCNVAQELCGQTAWMSIETLLED